MGSSSKNPFSLLFLSLTLFTITGFSSDNTKLVFKGCSEQKFQDPSEQYSKTLNTLFDSLISQSKNTSFSSTTTPSDSSDQSAAMYGLYQCRGDLTTSDCYTCVSSLPSMATKLCKKSMAARIQVTGCYLRYEIVGFKQVSDTEFLYKTCGSKQVSGTEFEGKRDDAFDLVEKGVENGNGFFTGSVESVFYVLGQCEGDLGSGDCGDCVMNALGNLKTRCGDSVFGQVYLQKCYVSYTYYPNGVTNTTSPGTEEELGQGQGQGQKQSTQKLVAIVVGGVAALGFGIACLLFLKSIFRKRAAAASKHGGGYY